MSHSLHTRRTYIHVNSRSVELLFVSLLPRKPPLPLPPTLQFFYHQLPFQRSCLPSYCAETNHRNGHPATYRMRSCHVVPFRQPGTVPAGNDNARTPARSDRRPSHTTHLLLSSGGQARPREPNTCHGCANATHDGNNLEQLPQDRALYHAGRRWCRCVFPAR